MSDWQVGDLAVCVDDAARPGSNPVNIARIKAGETYHVSAVVCGGLGLMLQGVPCLNHMGYWEDRFRKIRPDEQEACEPEFVTLLKRTKRTVPA